MSLSHKYVQMSVSLLVTVKLTTHNMETVSILITELETKVCEELDKIAENNTDESTHNSVDTIRLSLSSRLAEIRLMMSDKIRLRQALVNPRNRLNMLDQKILVLLNGVVKNPNTLRSKGMFTVTYNPGHTLNIALQNPLAIKTRDNCFLLALLASCNQFAQLKIKAAVIFSPSEKMKRVVESLVLWKTQSFLTENGSIRPDSQILSMIYDTITSNALELSVIQPVPPLLAALNDSLLEVSKSMISEELRL
jgi:hypothetical protein